MKPQTPKKPLVTLPSRDALAFAVALAEGPVQFSVNYGEVTCARLAALPEIADEAPMSEVPLSGVPMSGVRVRSAAGEIVEADPISVRVAA